MEVIRMKEKFELETQKQQEKINDLKKQIEFQHTQEIEFSNKLSNDIIDLKNQMENQKKQQEELLKEKE